MNVRRSRSELALVAFVALAMACSAGHGGPQADREKQPAAESQPAKVAGTQLRAIRVAVFDFDVLKGVDVEGGALTDRINAMLAAIPKVTIVNRDQIKRVAEEHKIALSGLVDSATAVRLGKFLSAQYIVVGRASRIGPAQYLVAKIVDVETTVQDTISTKASVEDGPGRLIDRLAARLGEAVRRLQLPLEVDAGAAALARLRAALKPLAGKAILVTVAERHVQRPLRDPAAQMTLTKRLQRLGFKVVVPKDPRAGWKEALLMTGKFADKNRLPPRGGTTMRTLILACSAAFMLLGWCTAQRLRRPDPRAGELPGPGGASSDRRPGQDRHRGRQGRGRPGRPGGGPGGESGPGRRGHRGL